MREDLCPTRGMGYRNEMLVLDQAVGGRGEKRRWNTWVFEFQKVIFKKIGGMPPPPLLEPCAKTDL